jgi:RNA polymerase sigma-70 factor (ECF subfamily)
VNSPHSSDLAAAVDRLSPDRRVLVLLCYHQGLTHQSVADILDIPLGTVKSRLHAVLVELRSMLDSSTTEHAR